MEQLSQSFDTWSAATHTPCTGGSRSITRYSNVMPPVPSAATMATAGAAEPVTDAYRLRTMRWATS